MSSFLRSVGHEPAPFFPAQFQGFEAKRNNILKHLAQSERLTEVRPASRLEVRPRPEMLSTGIAEVDALSGGIPRGCLTEIYGPASSGKSSVLLATIAAVIRLDETCVLVDASDSFDPASGQAAGVDFSKLLWVRCGAFKLSSVVRRRSSAQSNKAEHREPRTDESQAAIRFQSKHEREGRLEQVLKTTDLILQSGGFGLVALDLAGVPDKFVRRIPLASWFRFQRAVEHTKTALLVVSEFSCALTCAALALRLCAEPSAISHQPSATPAHAQLLESVRVKAEIARSRLERKPAQSVKSSFTTQTVRAG
jgi:recombination protein RecA